MQSCLATDSYTRVAIDRELADMGATPGQGSWLTATTDGTVFLQRLPAAS